MDARQAREARGNRAVEDGHTDSTANDSNQANTSTAERGRTLSRTLPLRPARTPRPSRAFPNPISNTLDQDLDVFMNQATSGTPRLPIDGNMTFDDFLSGLDDDAPELPNDQLPMGEERDGTSEWDEAARRDRSRRRFSRGLTAEEEYQNAYRTLDSGWVTGEERLEWQLRVQMAMDRSKREKEVR